jgi:hypothetical protein
MSDAKKPNRYGPIRRTIGIHVLTFRILQNEVTLTTFYIPMPARNDTLRKPIGGSARSSINHACSFPPSSSSIRYSALSS